ncbi:unnamed protein product [Protopolystoma xenopodis]|uniref:39S ribosomal protein L33, mitochondrial n=1 Tax=Protopolystoma xenopodis TaxID=117903 RepID=A0A448XQR1_9PLAT|nr:unnamed protein product [Protopolystoma xenopodis]
MSSPASSRGLVKIVLVLMESLSGSGHCIHGFRCKTQTTPKEVIAFDPLIQQNVIYREKKKIKTLHKTH